MSQYVSEVSGLSRAAIFAVTAYPTIAPRSGPPRFGNMQRTLGSMKPSLRDLTSNVSIAFEIVGEVMPRNSSSCLAVSGSATSRLPS